MKFHGTLGNVQAVGHFLVGQVLEQAGEYFLLAPAEFVRRVYAQPSPLRAAQDGIDEARKHRSRDPNASGGNLRQGARELFAGFRVRQDSLGPLAQQGVTIGIFQLVADNQQVGGRIALEDVAEKRPRGLARGVRVYHIYRRLWHVEIAQIRRQHRIEQLGRDLEAGILQQAMEFVQDHRMRRKKTDFQTGLAIRLAHSEFRLAELTSRGKADGAGDFIPDTGRMPRKPRL